MGRYQPQPTCHNRQTSELTTYKTRPMPATMPSRPRPTPAATPSPTAVPYETKTAASCCDDQDHRQLLRHQDQDHREVRRGASQTKKKSREGRRREKLPRQYSLVVLYCQQSAAVMSAAA